MCDVKDLFERTIMEQNKKTHLVCDECGEDFSRKFTLNRHKERKHQTGSGQKRPAETNAGSSAKRQRSDDPRKFYEVTHITKKYIAKFKTTRSTCKISFRDIDKRGEELALGRVFTAIFEDLTIGKMTDDLIRLTVQCSSLDYPIIVPFVRIVELTADRFMAEIERVLQSNEAFAIDEPLLFEVTVVDMPRGGARKRCKFLNTPKFLKTKKCIIQIQKKDDLCCARAIVTAKAKLDKHKKWNSIRTGKSLQETLARELHENAGVPVGKCGVEEIKKIQNTMIDYQIYVISKEYANRIIYKGPEAKKKIFLYHNDNHYDIITSMPAFLSKSYFCTKCDAGYDHKEKHRCNNACYRCRKIHDEEDADFKKCGICNRSFRGQVCFDLHIQKTSKGNSTCETIYRCQSCDKTVNRTIDKRHICGQINCPTCKAFYPKEHKCYMLQEKPKLLKMNKTAKTFIFFDLECTQEDLIQCDEGYKPDVFGKCQHCSKSSCGSLEHIPNMCVAQKVCEKCIDNENDCKKCGQRNNVFRGEETVKQFCTWLFSGDNNNATVICHNFQGYDSYPVLQHLYKEGCAPTIVPNGSKVMSLMIPECNITMIDSFNFLPMALSKLPSMFGLKELNKGYFPHLFNRKENQTVVMNGLPNKSYYHPDGMKPDDRNRFFEWYDKHEKDHFDFQRELLTYCSSDVDILRRCCLKFRKTFIDTTGIDPFETITIASACHRVFRANFLKPDTIALIPPHGYRPEQKQSRKAIQWIKYLSQSQGHCIQHAQNGGEKSIGPYSVDGYYETESGQKVVLEFHGDFWHGNPVKYLRNTVNPVNMLTMGELYDKTIEKKKYLEEKGYTYQSIWESDFDQQCQENLEMKTFLEDLDLVSPLEPREAFYGGRTEAYTLHKDASFDEDIDYYDVTSLYPWVNKTGKIPIGHPEIITENFQTLDQYEGLVKCKVLPPKGLFHPVLPCKVNGKLLFHLCKSCAGTSQQSPCTHTDDERSFVGTWVTDEVKEAVRMGYTVVKLYEIWHFTKISLYNPETKTGGIFVEYVNTFLKIKQEASGWPDWVKTEDDKNKYINIYNKKEGINLDSNKIEKNPGLRALAKLMLNSFWGKFGQNSNMQHVDIVTDIHTFFHKLTSDREEVTSVNFVSENAVEMRWKYKEDFVATNPRTNVIIAAYTTAQARLKLYSYLKQLEKRALYADTDSVIFFTKTGEQKLALGDYLGDLKAEVPDNSIKTFVTGGPKHYGYKLAQPDKDGHLTHCKIRGITLNFKNMSIVNFDVLEHYVTHRPDASVLVTNAHKITRNRESTQVVTTNDRKEYKLVFDKRVIRGNYVSYPYGF